MAYLIGFDIGTESVGWAVTDEQYVIPKKNGKALWGVYQFPEALKAEERRGFRIARRRLERREQRLAQLRDIFAREIAAVDPAFFQRMEESRFWAEDKRPDGEGRPLGRYTLFADRDYCDRDYHREFPTIYHLRRALMFEDRPFDVRLVYLAVHHILKKRGHFLFGDVALEDVTFASCLETLGEYLRDKYGLAFALADAQAFASALTDRSLNATRKRAALAAAAGDVAKDKQIAAVIDLLAGRKASAAALCAMEIEEDRKFSFKEGFDNAEAELADLLGETMPLVYHVKRLYDWSVLDELRAGERFLSEAKVKAYERHKSDLKRLRALLRPFPQAYKEMFRRAKEKLDNYAAYSGHGAAEYRCTYEKFCAYVKKQLNALRGDMDAAAREEADRVLGEMETGAFLPKQTTTDNGVIPHQLHEQELRVILERAARYLPFLSEVDESGLSAGEKILAIFRFRIPYYVGPLDTRSEHSWAVRTHEKIYPWNFDQVVDRARSAQRFIERMTAKCSYIGEPVLPRDSLLYSRFVALNMLNKLRVNGHPISVETKQRIYNECILQNACTRGKQLRDYLLSNGLMQKGDELTGMDEQFRISMTGYQVFRALLARGDAEPMVEDIIRHIVLFGEDRKLLETWLTTAYGERLSTEDRAYILRNRNKFGDWGNLSETFLRKILHTDPETGEMISIDEALWRTNCNLNELLSTEYTFVDALEQYRAERLGAKKQTLKDILEDSYASPGIRRAIHQSFAIIGEIEKLMGEPPKRVFVEVTRGEGTKERTQSRKSRLEALYKTCKKEAAEVYEQLQGYDEGPLRNAKLYLYFTQMGKCMYSGESIDLARLAVDYDIDHIYPQSAVKDDSFDNRVLVKRELNAAKKDRYPLAEDVRKAMHPFWTELKKRGFISDEKYRRLTRNTPFTDSERAGFIARQLVETGQAAKIVAGLLRRRYGDDRVVYVKAGNVSAFRQAQCLLPDGRQVQEGSCRGKNVKTVPDPLFVKCRDVNDFHHAKDAYLNIVVGNVYHTKFTRDPLRFVRSGQTYSMNRVFDYDVVRGGETAWKKGEDGTILTVRRMMRKNNILVTRFAREATGGLFDQQIKAKGKGQTPIKSSDPRMTVEKYGGYNKRAGAYFALIEHTEKKKRVRSLEAVFIMHKQLYEREPLRYCQEILGLEEPKILIPRIKIDALVSFDGFRMNISGRTGERIIYKNANQLVVSPEQAQYVKWISKYLERCKAAGRDMEITAFDGIDAERNIALYQLLLEKLGKTPYRIKYETPLNTLEAHARRFAELGIADQCRVLMQILNLFNTSAASADLKLLCGKAGIGILLTSKNISGYAGHSFLLIHQSVTGVFEKQIDLLGDEF